MDQHEVTQEVYEKIMNANPSGAIVKELAAATSTNATRVDSVDAVETLTRVILRIVPNVLQDRGSV